jgi:hydroxyacylglutathione hydrolase
MSDGSTLYLRQLLSGRDHAKDHPMAGQMMNFAYLVGCTESKECLVVDPSWDPQGIVEVAAEDGMKVVGGIATHGHPDHVGGEMMGMPIPGIVELADITGGTIHAPREDLMMIRAVTSMAEDAFTLHEDGGVIQVGSVRIDVMHTPGHTPGHMCLVADGNVITGDVLFVGACGRVDLPGSDPGEMFQSLKRLAALPGPTKVWPGHHYGTAITSTIENENRTNPTLHPETEEAWVRMMTAPPGW